MLRAILFLFSAYVQMVNWLFYLTPPHFGFWVVITLKFKSTLKDKMKTSRHNVVLQSLVSKLRIKIDQISVKCNTIHTALDQCRDNPDVYAAIESLPDSVREIQAEIGKVSFVVNDFDSSAISDCYPSSEIDQLNKQMKLSSIRTAHVFSNFMKSQYQLSEAAVTEFIHQDVFKTIPDFVAAMPTAVRSLHVVENE